MPRRSTRSSSSAAHLNKRPSDTPPLDQPRQIKRQKSSQGVSSKSKKNVLAPKKSKYFDAATSDGSENDLTPASSNIAPESISAIYEDDVTDQNARSTTTEDIEEGDSSDDAYDEEDDNTSNKPRNTSTKPRNTIESRQIKGGYKQGGDTKSHKAIKGQELWREGIKTGLGPGKEVFIKLAGPRDDGGIAYDDSTIHPNTFLFLKDLKKNNEREWLKRNDADYRKSKKDWDTFVEKLSEKISLKDDTIPELPAKDLVFRIYRDVRFSHDQTPYKPHFSAAWSRTGKKGPYAAYYLHLEPGKCFIGSGLWMPETSRLALIRQDIDRNSQRVKTILTRPDVRKEVFGGIPKDENKAVEAFVSQNKESALKTKPKGYHADNKNIKLLRLRSFTLSKGLQDQELLGPGALDNVASIVEILAPFVTYLNNIVMPDPVEEEEEEDETEDEATAGEDGEAI